MKTLKHILNISVLLLLGCVETDFEIPEETETEPQITGTEVTLASVKNALTQNSDGIVTFRETNTYFTGYVISSDVAGNFFKEVVIQDKALNPTSGITIQLNLNSIYLTYEPGRKIYVYLDGLSATVENGLVQLGIRDGNNISEIPTSLIPEYLVRSIDSEEIVPLPVAISEFSEAYESLYIILTQAQFNRNEVLGDSTKTYAGEATDEFDGIRLLESCTSRGNTLLSTSTFSQFKSVSLPQGSGSVQGVLSRDFYDDFYILRLNTLEDIDFESSSRCDPDELKCGLAETAGATILFKDDFSNQTRNQPIAGNGWANFAEYGVQSWEAYTATGTNASQGVSARIDSYQSGDALSVCWLITPAIDLAANSNVNIRFETSSSFADGSDLEVLYSTNWNGDASTITQAQWSILGDAFVIRDQDFFGDWYSSGTVNLSCAGGETGYVAFKYTGSTKDAFDGTYQLDNVMITAD